MSQYTSAVCLALLIALSSKGALAYEIVTHWQLSNASYGLSNLASESLLRQLGIKEVAEERLFRAFHRGGKRELYEVEPTCDPKTRMTLRQLLACGAMYEDIPGPRSFSHFFDPAHNGDPLTVYGYLKPGLVIGGNPNMPSPDWSIGDKDYPIGQMFSYRDARRYFFDALTKQGGASVPGGRTESWGKTFQALGQVIHHVQDMAQPQHTRNDPHADWFEPLGTTQLGQLRHPSRFEQYSKSTRGAAIIGGLISQGLDPVYPKYAAHFPLPRKFWIGDGRGLAEYSNANFVSQGTNFVASASGAAGKNPRFDSPIPSQAASRKISEVFNPIPLAVAQLCSGEIDSCEMMFYSNQWTDPLTNVNAANLLASTESIFDEDLNARTFEYNTENGTVTTSRIFALNRINFEAAYPFLIPKAVAYSAGLLNYFFRGQMTLSTPAEGVFAVVDHSSQRCKDSCGFTKVRIKLKNTTPNESMSAGNLVAVAKFRRNLCYREDLSGDPGGATFFGIGCRGTEEEAVVSNAVALTFLAEQEERTYTFEFDTAIPINATDLSLQVVFAGMLGIESGAVAVATKDIAEPNYLAVANVTDMVYDFGAHQYRPLPHSGYTQPDTLRGLSVAFTPGGAPLATLQQLAAPGHAQLAFLTDPGQQYLDIRYGSSNYTVNSPVQGSLPVSEFYSPPNSGVYGRTVEFTKSRGVYRNMFIFHRFPADLTVHDCTVEVELCAQTGMPSLNPSSAVEWTVSF